MLIKLFRDIHQDRGLIHLQLGIFLRIIKVQTPLSVYKFTPRPVHTSHYNCVTVLKEISCFSICQFYRLCPANRQFRKTSGRFMVLQSSQLQFRDLGRTFMFLPSQKQYHCLKGHQRASCSHYWFDGQFVAPNPSTYPALIKDSDFKFE